MHSWMSSYSFICNFIFCTISADRPVKLETTVTSSCHTLHVTLMTRHTILCLSSPSVLTSNGDSTSAVYLFHLSFLILYIPHSVLVYLHQLHIWQVFILFSVVCHSIRMYALWCSWRSHRQWSRLCSTLCCVVPCKVLLLLHALDKGDMRTTNGCMCGYTPRMITGLERWSPLCYIRYQNPCEVAVPTLTRVVVVTRNMKQLLVEGG